MVQQQFWGAEERRRDYLDLLGEFVYGYRCTNDAVSNCILRLVYYGYLPPPKSPRATFRLSREGLRPRLGRGCDLTVMMGPDHSSGTDRAGYVFA